MRYKEFDVFTMLKGNSGLIEDSRKHFTSLGRVELYIDRYLSKYILEEGDKIQFNIEVVFVERD